MYHSNSTHSSTDVVFDQLIAFQTRMLQLLNLPYRVLEMPTEELGLSAFRKVDCEIWIPSLKSFGEVSSASNCTGKKVDFSDFSCFAIMFCDVAFVDFRFRLFSNPIIIL
jgi:hypothetical protein